MKKLLALLLSFSMILCFAACGNDDEVKEKDKDEDKSESTTVENESTTEEEETTTEEQTTEEETTEAPEDNTSSIKRGTIDGNVYENKSVGIKFTKPDDWYYYTDEEIAEAMQLGAEMMNATEFEQALTQQLSMTDMMLQHAETGTSITVAFENINRAGTRHLTEEDYISALDIQFQRIEGTEVERIGDTASVKLGEKEFTKAEYEMTIGGLSTDMIIYVAKIDTHMCAISVSTYFGDLSEIEAMFS